MDESGVKQLLGHLFRHESGKMTATLTKLLGFDHYDVAEDIVQDALMSAMHSWKFKGVPDSPTAWLYTVAKRKAIDYIRQLNLRQQIHQRPEFRSEYILSTTVQQQFQPEAIEDSQLRMIFVCCHPAIPYESQIALALKTLCGLSTGEIARTFFTNEETIAKRIYRAREKIRNEKISLDLPGLVDISKRLDAVLHTLYLLFNEGYHATGDQVIRQDLCEEALRLTQLLTSNEITNRPEVNALMALMCLNLARIESRLNDEGAIILLEEQDRSKWNQSLISKGFMCLDHATTGDRLTAYHVEASIAAFHCSASSFKSTNWMAIFKLYQSLEQIQNDPVVRMNKAIAEGYAISFESGLNSLLKIKELNGWHLYHTAVGDFYHKTGEIESAISRYQQAISLVKSSHEKDLLIRKLQLF